MFTFGIFTTFYLIFCRVAPVVAVAEIKSILKSSGNQYTEKNIEKKYVAAQEAANKGEKVLEEAHH
jgi:molybdopterin-containing oxidoreductase family membrane subunit